MPFLSPRACRKAWPSAIPVSFVVVLVDVQVARHLFDGDVEEPVPREQLQHVVEEADAGRDLGLAGSVEMDRHGDIGLGGAAADARGAHGRGSLRVDGRAF